MSLVECFKNDLLSTLSTLAVKDFNAQESIDYLVPTLSKLITSTSDLESNKFVLTSLLFKIWQRHQSPADQLDYNIFKMNFILSADLYLELIKALNLENEVRKLLYSIPRLTVQKIVESLIYSNPSYGLRTVYDPALNVCNSLDCQHRSEFVLSLLQMMAEHCKIIKTDDKLLFELLHSTAIHIKSHLDYNSSLNKDLDTPQNFENIQSNVEVDYLFSTSFYPDKISKSRQKRADQMVSQIINTSKSFESLNTRPKRAFGDNKYLYQLLCLFDCLTLIACKGDRHSSQVNPSMKYIIRRVILQLKEADLTNVLSSLNKVYSTENESINYLLELINIEPPQRLSNFESRSERISRRLREDKSEYQNASLNPYDLNSNNEKNRESITKHEAAFITICQSLRRNLDYNASFANRIEDSDLTFKLGTPKEGLTKKDLTNYCHWVVNSIRFGRLGFVSLLKLMVQYIDLFNDLNIDEEIFSGLIVDYGFQRELYQSIKRLIKNHGENKNKIKTGINIFLKAFSLLPRHTRCLFRDFMLSDRPSDTDFRSPTFDDWLIWPIEYDQRLTTLCNQIVFTAEKNSQKSSDDKSQLIIKNKEDYIRSSDVDALIELSMIAPYFMLNRLLSDCIHNKGEGLLIIDILREIGSVCWFRQTSKSPALVIKVIQYTLSSLDKGILCFNLQERKNLIDFLILAMVGNTAKSPIELTLFDIGEWSDNKLLLDIREYIKYCVMPYLNSSNLDGRKVTLSLSLDILKVILFPSVSTLPPANISWFIKSIPFPLLKSMASLFDQRKAMSFQIMNSIDNIYMVLKGLMKLLAGYISSFPNDYDQDNIHNSNAILIRQFYDESRKFDWTTQLFLRNFFEICEDRLGIKIGKPILPAMLLSFCDLSKEEFVIIDEDYENDSTKVKQMMTFLEGCRVSGDWCDKFISDLNRSQTITKPFLRNLFRTIAPLAFCHILANSAGEESSLLLDDFLKKLFFNGCLSAVELLTFDENDNELNELAVAGLSFDERISLCCLRFSFINILTSLHHLKEQKTSSNDEQQVPSQDIINDFRIIQNVIKVAKESFMMPNSTLNYLIVLFYTIAQALPLLSFSFKAEESLYIFLLSIVNLIDNTRIIATHKKSKTEIDVDNESSSNKKNRKKKKRIEKRQKDKKQEFDQQLELTQETDTVDKESVKMYSDQRKKSVDGPLIIEYSEWQERILTRGIKKVKNDNCGWRFTVADALGIRNELIDHDK